MSRFGSCFSPLRLCRRPTAYPHSISRRVHQAKALKYLIEEGLGEFLPPAALKVVAHEYQQGLLERLNEEVRGTDLQDKSVVQTIISAASDRTKTLAFNYASLALNNHFFLEQLTPPTEVPDHQHLLSQELETQIRLQHGSLAQLKSTFSAAAMGMFTNGWVWFVTDASGNTAIIPTFGPGSLLMRSRTYMAHSKTTDLGHDMLQWNRGDPLSDDDPYMAEWAEEMKSRSQQGGSEVQGESTPSTPAHPAPTSKSAPPGTTPSSPASGVSGPTATPTGKNFPRFIHSTSARQVLDTDMLTGGPQGLWMDDAQSARHRDQPKSLNKVNVLTMGETLYPLFCISVNEHAWMSAGYGVWGKEEWLKKFWSVVDWGKVSAAYRHYAVKDVQDSKKD